MTGYVDAAIVKYWDFVAPIGVDVIRNDAQLILDGTPCNEARGWYGEKPGCTRDKVKSADKKAKPKAAKNPPGAKSIDAVIESNPKTAKLSKKEKAAIAGKVAEKIAPTTEPLARTSPSHRFLSRQLSIDDEIPSEQDVKAVSNDLAKKTGMSLGDAEQSVRAVAAFSNDRFAAIRADERDGKATEEIKAINRYIAAAPKYDGNIYRGLGFSDKAKFNAFMKQAQIGGTIELDAMSSFSSIAQNAENYTRRSGAGSGGKVVLSVKNSSGVSIRDVSENPSENEVLVPKGTKYRVAGKKEINGITHIQLEELGSTSKESSPRSTGSKTKTPPTKPAEQKQGGMSETIAKFKAGKPLTPEESAQLKTFIAGRLK